MSPELELETESESAVMMFAESVAWLDCDLEEEDLEDGLPDEDFPERDLPEVLPADAFGEVDSSGSRLWHSEAT